MELCRVALEGHGGAGTIYITGILASAAADRADQIVAGLPPATRVVRMDLRGVEYIDPDAFVRLARRLARWREASGGRVTIEFPRRSGQRPRGGSSAALGESRGVFGAISRGSVGIFSVGRTWFVEGATV